MVFPIYSRAYYEWHMTNNPEKFAEETRRLWRLYKQSERKNAELEDEIKSYESKDYEDTLKAVRP